MKKNNRALSFGLNSLFLTLVVIGILGVINFAGKQYPQKVDTTKNKLHTFSDQSQKVMKSLKGELNAELYGDFGAREKYRPLIENYKKLSNQFKFELIDPNKEPTRARTAGIKQMETLVLKYQGKTSKVEEITEEKVTNAIIKLTQDKTQVVCAVTGHGEKSISDRAPEGFARVEKGLQDQGYEIKEFNLLKDGKIPAECQSLLILGPEKAFFANEIKALNEYYTAGGRGVILVGAAVGRADESREIRDFLKEWGVDLKGGLTIDPDARLAQMDASVPIVVDFNNTVPAGKGAKQVSAFPFARPVDPIVPAPNGLTVNWLARTSPKSWAEQDLASVTKGAVQYNAGTDIRGPITVGVVINGKKDEKASRESRLAVFGSSMFANVQFSRIAGNLDLILNAISWTLEDESLISIRSKEDENGKIELSQNQNIAILVFGVAAIPILIAVLGIVIWIRRKKL